ncbi:MAG: type II toxin-antitoxin system mRNA interferase toxin, RelE/StbE family [Candidatus Paceibacterota bacterium]|jgi:addiction module RelE/StbE family toxin
MNSIIVYYSKDFKRDWDKLPEEIKCSAVGKEKIFKQNPFHPSLKIHQLKGRLKGLWSIHVNMQYRIILQFEEDCVIFIAIGTHGIYDRF